MPTFSFGATMPKGRPDLPEGYDKYNKVPVVFQPNRKLGRIVSWGNLLAGERAMSWQRLTATMGAPIIVLATKKPSIPSKFLQEVPDG